MPSHLYTLPSQIHYTRTRGKPPEMVELQAHLLRMGYVVVERDDNMACLGCTELTLIRAGCPQEGVYDTSR